MGKLGSRSYSANASDYRLLEEVGYGASATVYRAIYLPLNEVVAVKCLDLDRCNSNLDDVRREAQTMSLIDHPNVVSAYCSFVVEHNLWVVMPFMAEGSCLHLMKIAYPDGFEEVAIGAILKETLRALQYLHQHGHIHRDVKAGNILLDTNGAVKLADFGVSACMFDSGDRQRSRNTFVGTPCWMAPEVLQPGRGYTSKADIWSFGITALELAHGHAPFSKHPPMKVLLMTIQNAPPGLDYDRDKKFSKSFKEMVAMCLVKDQTKRPTAEKLLKHSFFKLVKAPEIIVKKLFTDLPPLWNRVKALQHKDSAQLALKKMPSSEEEAISQNEYKRGVSAWNFDVEDLKDQASLVQDDEDFSETKEDVNIKSLDPSCPQSTLAESISSSEIHGRENGNAESRLPQPHRLCSKPGSQTCVGPYASSQDPERSGSSIELMPSTSESDIVPTKTRTSLMKGRQTQSGPLVPRVMLAHSFSEKGMASERCEYECLPTTEKASQDVQRPSSFSGPLMLPKRASANSFSAPIKSSGGYRDSLDDRSKANFIQIKGRFSVTSENVDLVKDIPLCTASRKSSQGSPLRKSASVGNWITETKLMSRSQRHKDCGNSDVHSSLLMSHLHNLFQQTSVQQDLIVNLLTCLQPPLIPDALQSGKLPPLPGSPESNEAASFPVEMDASERERQLLIKISELHSRMYGLSEELNAEKLKFKQLQQQLDAISSGEYEDRGGEP